MAERTGASEPPRGVGWRLWLWWVLASVVGWGVGWVVGPAIVLFGGVIGEMDEALIVLLVAVLWGVGGLVGGAITGAVLVWLLRQRVVDADGVGGAW